MSPDQSIADRVFEALVSSGVVTAEQVSLAVETAAAEGLTPDAVLLERGLVNADDIAGVLEESLGVPRVDLASYAPDAEALDLLPASIAREQHVLPLFEIEGMLTVAVGAPFDVFRLDPLAARLGREVEVVLADPAALATALEVYYAEGAEAPATASNEAGRAAEALLRDDPLAEAPAISDVSVPPADFGQAPEAELEDAIPAPPIMEEAEHLEAPVEPVAVPVIGGLEAEAPATGETPGGPDETRSAAEALADALEREAEPGAAIDLDVLGVADARAVSLLVADILEDAAERGASHVHLLPYRDDFFLVYRVEGRLTKVASAPRSLARPLLDGFRGFARIAPESGDAPASGRVRHFAAGRDISVTVSAVTTLAGQRLVVTLAPVREEPPALAALGMGDMEARALTGAAERGRGVLLIAAPAGSGAEVTYFSLLAAASAAGRTVFSIERSATWELPSVAQAFVDAQPGATATALLQAGLAQDTDVLALQGVTSAGEMRMVLEAAAAGKLVVITVAASGAVDGIVRALEMGADPASLGMGLAASLGQRVLRANCSACAAETVSSLTGLVPGLADGERTMAGTGCTECGGTGQRGTVALFELLPVTDPVRRAIARGAQADDLAALAESAGLRPMVMSGAERIRQGALTPEELDRVVGLTLP